MSRIFTSQWSVMSRSYLKWSSKIKARMVDLDQNVMCVLASKFECMWSAAESGWCYSSGYVFKLSVETIPEQLLQHTMETSSFIIQTFNLPTSSFTIHLRKEWKNFNYLIIIFHYNFLRLNYIFRWPWGEKHKGTTTSGQWIHTKAEDPLWNKVTYMLPIFPNG